MSADTYTILATAMRYFFSALIVVLVWTAWKGALRDSGKARALRRLAPESGAIGEFIVRSSVRGSLKAGTRIPIPREGLVGSSSQADVRLKTRGVHRLHALIEQREDGILLKSFGKNEITVNGNRGRTLLIRNGERFTVGEVALTLHLYDSPAEDDDFDLDALFSAKKHRGRRSRDEELFLSEDEYEESSRSSGKRTKKPVPVDELDPDIVFAPKRSTTKKAPSRQIFRSAKLDVCMPFEDKPASRRKVGKH